MWHRCPFPIGWLMNKDVFFPETPLTTGLFDGRWYTSHRPKPKIFQKDIIFLVLNVGNGWVAGGCWDDY